MARLALLLVLLALPARAEEIVAALSQTRVAITTTFGGSEILVFGAIKREEPQPDGAPVEVVIAVEGPRAPVDVRRKSRAAGIWVNTQSVEIDSAPTFYAVASTGPLFGVLSHTEDLRHRISIARGIRSVGAPPEVSDAAGFTDALIRLRMAEGLYRVDESSVILSEDTLFRTSVALPANLTEGRYRVRIFLTRGKSVVDSDAASIFVHKVGLERFVYTLAYDRPFVYGALAIALAALAGWAASAAFRFIRS